MIRSFTSLRWGLLGIVVVGSLGFGATQAVAKPQVSREEACNPWDAREHQRCQELGYGGCSFATWQCE